MVQRWALGVGVGGVNAFRGTLAVGNRSLFGLGAILQKGKKKARTEWVVLVAFNI